MPFSSKSAWNNSENSHLVLSSYFFIACFWAFLPRKWRTKLCISSVFTEWFKHLRHWQTQLWTFHGNAQGACCMLMHAFYSNHSLFILVILDSSVLPMHINSSLGGRIGSISSFYYSFRGNTVDTNSVLSTLMPLYLHWIYPHWIYTRLEILKTNKQKKYQKCIVPFWKNIFCDQEVLGCKKSPWS